MLRYSARACLKRAEELMEHLLDARAGVACPGYSEICAITEARKIRVELKQHFEIFPLQGEERPEVGGQ
ncbi:MAG TPA: hypothetical protein VJN18_14770 [Polyangiaceae bacterium]|nr:hypothetical protein [Polyangiaceae bacterium]